jgi:OOP family OmpA-OmpF porin
VRVVISGHTDMTGIEARNSSLSMRRALVLRKTLQAVFRKRAPGLRVTAMQCAGKGVSEPIGDNATEAGRQANRRATARIIIGATPSKTNGDTDRGGRPRRRRR